MLYDQGMAEEAFIEQELTFSDKDRLRRIALKAVRGLLAWRCLEPKEIYSEEVRVGIHFCREFKKGYELVKRGFPDSASDLPLWYAFREITSRPKAKGGRSLEDLIVGVSEIERTLSLIADKKEIVDEQKFETCRRFLLDAVHLLW